MKTLLKYQHWLFLIVISTTLAIGTRGLNLITDFRTDYTHYQAFTEKLASGVLDLSIPGFHGSDFIGAIWFIISGSSMSHIQFQWFSGILIPIAAYLAASSIFKSKIHGVLFAAIAALMPYVSYSYISGYTQPANILFFLLTIYGAAKNKWWTGFAWAIAITTKPFAIILLPLLVILAPKKGSFLKKYRSLIIGIALAALYVAVQYLQIGNVLIGVHPDSNVINIWRAPLDAIRNAAWGVQTLFSVHNYFFSDPAATGHWNMLHTTPILIFLGLFALFSPKQYFKKASKLHLGLILTVAFGFFLNTIVSMDNFYMQFLVFALILSALPVLIEHPIWIPIVLLTLHYQWFYFYLDYSELVEIKPIAFAVLVLIDAIAFVWCALNVKRVMQYLKDIFCVA